MILTLVLPLSLAVMLFCVGLSLRFAALTALVEKPKPLLVGLGFQAVLLPVAALIWLWLWQWPSELALALVLVSLAPGGATSNMLSLLAKGDVALSVSLTAVMSLLAPLTIPPLSVLAVQLWLGESASVSLWPIWGKMLLIALLPVLLGLLLNSFYPLIAQRLQRWLKPCSTLLLVAVIGLLLVKNWPQVSAQPLWLGLQMMGFVSLLAGFVWGLAKRCQLSSEQCVTLALEVAIQNVALVLFVASQLGLSESLISALLSYGIWMQLPAICLVVVRNRTATGSLRLAGR